MFLRAKTREKDGKKHRYFVSRMAGSERTIGLFPAKTCRSRIRLNFPIPVAQRKPT
jgi:hypothetical protein